MLKKIISLSLAFSLLSQSLLAALSQYAPDKHEYALAISQGLFDGKGKFLRLSAQTPPPECQQDPSQCEVATEQVVDENSIERTNEARKWWFEEDKKCKEAEKPGCAGRMPSYFDYMSTKTTYRVKRKPQEQDSSMENDDRGPRESSSEHSSPSSSSPYDQISSMSDSEILGNFLVYGSLFGLFLSLGVGWIHSPEAVKGFGLLATFFTAGPALAYALPTTGIVIRETVRLATGLLIAPSLAIRDSFLPERQAKTRTISKALGPLPTLAYWAPPESPCFLVPWPISRL